MSECCVLMLELLLELIENYLTLSIAVKLFKE